MEKKVIMIGANIGLTGCQMIRLQEASIVLNKAGVDLLVFTCDQDGNPNF